MKAKKVLFVVVICIAAAVLAFCVFKLVDYYASADEEQAVYDDLSAYASATIDEDSDPGEIIEVPSDISMSFRTGFFGDEKYFFDPGLNDYYDILANMNIDALKNDYPDTAAWIYIPGTQISYPVMSSEGEYYLRRNIAGEHMTSGALFFFNTMSFDDQPDNLVIHGHNMKSGMMFGSLKAFWLENGMWNGNNYFYIDLPGGKTQTYQMFAMYIDNTLENPVPNNFSSADEKLKYFDYIRKKATKFYVDLGLGADDTIITLSTCTHLENAGDNDRLLVQAKLIG